MFGQVVNVDRNERAAAKARASREHQAKFGGWRAVPLRHAITKRSCAIERQEFGDQLVAGAEPHCPRIAPPRSGASSTASTERSASSPPSSGKRRRSDSESSRGVANVAQSGARFALQIGSSPSLDIARFPRLRLKSRKVPGNQLAPQL